MLNWINLEEFSFNSFLFFERFQIRRIFEWICNDKEYAEIINNLARVAENIIFTKPLDALKAVPPTDLAAVLNVEKKFYIYENCVEAVRFAQKITQKSDIILCTGSLYLIGDIRREFA